MMCFLLCKIRSNKIRDVERSSSKTTNLVLILELLKCSNRPKSVQLGVKFDLTLWPPG